MFRRSFVSQVFQQVFRFGPDKQISRLPLRFQFSQQESGEPVLLFFREIRRSLERPLEKWVRLSFSTRERISILELQRRGLTNSVQC